MADEATEPPQQLVGWGAISTPAGDDANAHRVRRYPELVGQQAIATVAAVVFTVYQFCNVHHYLYGGTPGYTILNSLDAAVPWLLVLVTFRVFQPVAQSLIERRPLARSRRRATRLLLCILPLYVLAIVVVWVPRQDRFPGDWADLLEHLTFTQVFDGKRIFYTIGPAWAVSVEVICLVVVLALSAGLAWLFGRVETSRRERVVVLLGFATVLALGAVAWKAWSFWGRSRPTDASFTTWFGPLANLDCVAVGVILAVGVEAARHRSFAPRDRLVLRAIGGILLVVAFAIREPGTWTTVFFTSLCALGFGCVVGSAVLPGPAPDRWTRWLSHRALGWLGALSLGLYLWHEPVMLSLRDHGLVRQRPGDFVRDLVVVAIATVVVSWLSYQVIERPTGQVIDLLDRGVRRAQTWGGAEVEGNDVGAAVSAR